MLRDIWIDECRGANDFRDIINAVERRINRIIGVK
jgi:hypothetical protein